MELQQIVERYAEALAHVDATTTVLGVNARTKKPYQPGIQPMTESVVEFVGNFLDMLLVIVLCNFDVGGSCRRLQQVSWDVVLVVCEKGEGESWSQGRGGGEEKARVLGGQSRLAA